MRVLVLDNHIDRFESWMLLQRPSKSMVECRKLGGILTSFMCLAHSEKDTAGRKHDRRRIYLSNAILHA